MAFYMRGGAGGDGMSAYLEAQKKRGKKTDAHEDLWAIICTQIPWTLSTPCLLRCRHTHNEAL